MDSLDRKTITRTVKQSNLTHMQKTILRVGQAIVLLALTIQLVFLFANAVGKDKAITRQSKAILGITW